MAASLDWYILSFQTLDEMHFTDRVRTVNCVYDPCKPYGSRNRCDPVAQITPEIYWRSPNEMQFPIVYGPKTAFTIRTNGTDRQAAVTPSLEWHVIYINVTLMRNNFQIAYGPKTVFYDLPNGTDRRLVVSNRISLCIMAAIAQCTGWKLSMCLIDLGMMNSIATLYVLIKVLSR